jgi:hypothetical protein
MTSAHPLVAIVGLIAACSRDAPQPEDAQRPSPSATRVDGLPDLVSPTAFGLASAPFGATVVWAGRNESGVGLFALDLNDVGQPERAAFELVRISEEVRSIADVSTCWQGMNRAVVWIERVAGEARVQAAYKPEVGPVRRFDLGLGYPAPLAARGNVALAAGQSDVSVFVRGASEPCVEASDSSCFGFRFHRVANVEEPSPRVTLSVPVPCEEAAAQLLVTKDRWYYSVCTARRREPIVTLFTIEPELSYAAARELFLGCAPLGLVTAEGRPALLARCGGRTHVAWLGAADGEPAGESFEPRIPTCDDLPTVHVGGQHFRLSEPHAGLEAFLPESLSPRGSLAVWTGRALIVAEPREGVLHLRRHGCRGDEFVELSAPEVALPKGEPLHSPP